jgi:hypothetical protein
VKRERSQPCLGLGNCSVARLLMVPSLPLWTKGLQRLECIFSLSDPGDWMEGHIPTQRSSEVGLALKGPWGTNQHQGGASHRRIRFSCLHSYRVPPRYTWAATTFLADWGRTFRWSPLLAGNTQHRSWLSRDMPGCKWCCLTWAKGNLARWYPCKGRPWWVF